MALISAYGNSGAPAYRPASDSSGSANSHWNEVGERYCSQGTVKLRTESVSSKGPAFCSQPSETLGFSAYCSRPFASIDFVTAQPREAGL